MPMSKEDMKIWLDKADDKDAESIERAKNFVERVKTLGLSECSLCACTDFIPRILNPLVCKRDGCGHSITDHVF